MSARMRLPNRRLHETIVIKHRGFEFRAGIGRFPDGRLAEIFFNSSKAGATVETAARDSAIICSIALQHGISADEIRHSILREEDGSASGVLGALLDLLHESN